MCDNIPILFRWEFVTETLEKKRGNYSITIAGLNDRAVSALTCPLPSASTMWTGSPNSCSGNDFVI